MAEPRLLNDVPVVRPAADPRPVDGPVAGESRDRRGQLRELMAYENGRPFLDSVHPADRARVAAALGAAGSGDASGLDAEFRLVGAGGDVRRVRARSCRVRDEPSGVARIARIAEDVTDDRADRDALDARLIDAQKLQAVAQLASGAAREFNDRLSVIMGNSDLMMQALSPDHPAYANAVEIQRAAEGAARLTRQLLIFSRRQAAQFGVLDINEVVRRMDGLLRSLIDDRIEMTVTCGARVGRVVADAASLEQVLVNLVVNARQAMPHGGRLAISTSDITIDPAHAAAHEGGIRGAFVRLSVSDTGSGMSEQIRPHLFDATAADPHFTGLGLAACQAIVTQVGGHIDVETAPDGGAAFHVSFPPAASGDPAAESAADQAPPRGTETVLVVEDEPGLRRLACAMLAAQGYSVLSAVDGLDGLRVAREHRGAVIRLVVTDIVMPHMDGNVMAEWLQSGRPDLKVLLISGYSDQAIARRGVIGAGVAFLSKPFTRATIAHKVRAVLDAPAHPDDARRRITASHDGDPVPLSRSETVLLVEHDATLRELAADLLRGHGYIVLTAADRTGALSVVDQDGRARIDLLITDLPTPDADGRALTDWIHALLPENKTLFVSASGDDPAQLRKPMTPSGLSAGVRAALNR
jgi:two-component system, cell cycle sensor histidine kinase and response regulator CckA